ncbi:hypothetical protein [Pseudomonas rhizosphaerae]|jgi:hypothetical protein|uniref:hypothetical protein n=1 Tax=Pseudomonas rhizosphaerae TaxID=216142 RepID=UPI001787076A|nr:hypothetical protein [Pseudomonas rhizosphaerae]MBD8616218.1 hypothetical protein [Pseudomonas putida]MEB2871630.1 hypothetical protein [Pseudomonas rhizosphaerae]
MKRLSTTLLTYTFLSLIITGHADQITPNPESLPPPAVITAITEQASDPLMHVQTANSIFQVVEAINGHLDPAAVDTQATVKVAYPTLDARDTVGIRWSGSAVRDSPIQTATSSGELNFAVPKAWVSENIGRSVTLTYSYKEGGTGTLYTSTPLSIAVTGEQSGSTTFNVVEAVNGTLDAAALGTQATVKVAYPTLDARDTVGIRWSGSAVRDSPIQTAASSSELTFAVPKAWVSENIGRSVTLTYSYKEGGTGTLYMSAPINIQIVDTIPIGQQVAVNLNARFIDTAKTCASGTPAYYCNGVILRTTEIGNYDPWDPSPSAIRLGGVSFSYIRSDAFVNSLYHNHGFIFLPQEQATTKGQAPSYLCIYAYDAGTIVGARSDKGCGLKARSLTAADLSSCSTQGVQTPAQWYAYTKQIPSRDYQCSLSMQIAEQFATSIAVRANKPSNMDSIWNEIMVETWPQGAGARLPIEAFFYTGNGLSGAKTAQTKFKQRTDLTVPIVRLNFSQSASGPFSYDAADQAIRP